jgi:hypothetical protein
MPYSEHFRLKINSRMTELHVRHQSSYTYEGEIFPEPHHLYFYPLQRSFYRLKYFELKVEPEPAGMGIRLDEEGNTYHQCWFNGLTNKVEFMVDFTCALGSFNPFDFLAEETYDPERSKMLEVFLGNKLPLESKFSDWINSIKSNTSVNLVDLFGSLINEIHSGWSHEVSYQSGLIDPNKCFELKKGSCRDLSWMLIQILRYLGIPARFVSGYSHNPEIDGHELHAWVEAWMPGAGWIAIDPSSGLFVNEMYIPVCTSHHPKLTLPVQGNFRGKYKSRLETRVEITIGESE